MNLFSMSYKTWWSWRESNPRPNEEATGFLHAYPRLVFRAPAGSEPPTGTLALVNFTGMPEQHLS